jgi:hypothetical protein
MPYTDIIIPSVKLFNDVVEIKNKKPILKKDLKQKKMTIKKIRTKIDIKTK